MKDESAADPAQDPGSGPAQQPGEMLTERRLVTRHRRVRRPLGAGYWLTALVVAAALVATTTYTQRETVETALAADVDKRLAARGLGKVEVTLQGRVVTAAVPAGEDTEKVERTVTGVTGVAEVETTQSFANAEQRRTCQALGRELDRATDNQRIPFVGETARLTPEGLALVRSAAQVLKECPVGDVVVGGHSDDDTPGGSTLSLTRARLMVDLLEGAGVDSERLEARGYGDQFPVDDSDTTAARQRNQRGEIRAENS